MHCHHGLPNHNSDEASTTVRVLNVSPHKSFMNRVVSHDSIMQNGRLQLPLKNTQERVPSIPIRSRTPQRMTSLNRVTSVPANMKTGREIAIQRSSRNEPPSRMLHRAESKRFSRTASVPTIIFAEPSSSSSRPGIRREQSNRNFVFSSNPEHAKDKLARISSVPTLLATTKQSSSPYEASTFQSQQQRAYRTVFPERMIQSPIHCQRSPLKTSGPTTPCPLHRTDGQEDMQALLSIRRSMISQSSPNLVLAKAIAFERELSSSDVSPRSKSFARTQSGQFMPNKPTRRSSLEVEGSNNNVSRNRNANFNAILSQQNPHTIKKTATALTPGVNSAWKQNQMILLNQKKQQQNISTSNMPVLSVKKNIFLQSMSSNLKGAASPLEETSSFSLKEERVIICGPQPTVSQISMDSALLRNEVDNGCRYGRGGLLAEEKFHKPLKGIREQEYFASSISMDSTIYDSLI